MQLSEYIYKKRNSAKHVYIFIVEKNANMSSLKMETYSTSVRVEERA